MKKDYLWTKSKARLKLIKANSEAKYNWVFLPGGPGFGSEYLSGLTKNLSLPGAIWHCDLPGDGSNTTVDDAKYFASWSNALIEVVSALNNVILVAHSAGGMFALATPKIEKFLNGLVLISSAPDQSWQKIFHQYAKDHPLPEREKKLKKYASHPSNKTFKEFVISVAPYYSSNAKGLKKIIAMLNTLSFNYKTYHWSDKTFYPDYIARWIPKSIPTLIFTGDEDHVTPPHLFSKIKKFRRKNILIREIKHAGHFPWIDRPEQVATLFEEYCGSIGYTKAVKK